MKIIITDINRYYNVYNGFSAQRKPQRPPYNILRVLRSQRENNHRIPCNQERHTHTHSLGLTVFIIIIRYHGRLVIFVCAGNYNLR